jgi:hypothetical protein
MIKRWYIQRLESECVTARYIHWKARKNGYGPIKELFWQEEGARRLATRWRAGAYSSTRFNCPSGHKFTRRCIGVGCFTIHAVTGEEDLALRRPDNPPEHYCAIDYMLNMELKEEAATTLAELASQLEL